MSGGMRLSHTAAREGRLLGFLRGEMGLSGALIRRLKVQGSLRVEGEIAHTNRLVRVGEEIQVTIVEQQPDVPAEDGPLAILYEDDALIALDKPPGLLMHPTFHRLHGTLANRLLGYYQRTGQPCAVHLVSRLDRDTFGVVLAAKNAHVHALLCGQMARGGFAKAYRALVYGQPQADCGEWDAPIARLSPTSLLRCAREGGQAARTGYRVLARAEDCALLALTPHTGRTHQLRVHCAHAGLPIAGDMQYGTEASLAFSARHGFVHQQLCAARLAFDHPVDGRRLEVVSAQAVGWPGSDGGYGEDDLR